MPFQGQYHLLQHINHIQQVNNVFSIVAEFRF